MTPLDAVRAGIDKEIIEDAIKRLGRKDEWELRMKERANGLKRALQIVAQVENKPQEATK